MMEFAVVFLLGFVIAVVLLIVLSALVKSSRVDDNTQFTHTADIVEVTRCKNCENYNRHDSASGFGWCMIYNYVKMDNHYCDFGKCKGCSTCDGLACDGCEMYEEG